MTTLTSEHYTTHDMTHLIGEFFATYDGEPWCAFVWGQHPPEMIGTDAIKARLMREAEIFDLDEEMRGHVAEAMAQPPYHLFIRPDGEMEDAAMFVFCAADHVGAKAITGWKLR